MRIIWEIKKKGEDFAKTEGDVIKRELAVQIWDSALKSPLGSIVLGEPEGGGPSWVEYAFKIPKKTFSKAKAAKLVVCPLDVHGVKMGSAFRIFVCSALIYQCIQLNKWRPPFPDYGCKENKTTFNIQLGFIKKETVVRISVGECQSADIHYIKLQING